MDIPLSIAISHYDHVQDLVSGKVRPEGIAPTFLQMTVEEIFFRFSKYREWDVSEMSFGLYVAMKSRGDDSIIAIPVFPSRVFRHSSLFVLTDSEIDDPAQLAGCRVGIPEWAQTASIYTRGLLENEYGVPLNTIEWLQAGVDEPGRREKVALSLPDGVAYRAVPDQSLDEMLLAGDIDAVMSAHPPASFEAGNPRVRRLFRDAEGVEQDYYQATGVFPIMHIVAIQRPVLEAHPWIAGNLYAAFDEARRRSVARAVETTASRFPVPFLAHIAKNAQDIFGDQLFPYGIAENLTTLETFLGHAYKQGVTARRLDIDEIFAATTQEFFKV